MSAKAITLKDENGKEFEIVIETDPNWIPDEEYQDEDGNWISDSEEDEE